MNSPTDCIYKLTQTTRKDSLHGILVFFQASKILVFHFYIFNQVNVHGLFLHNNHFLPFNAEVNYPSHFQHSKYLRSIHFA